MNKKGKIEKESYLSTRRRGIRANSKNRDQFKGREGGHRWGKGSLFKKKSKVGGRNTVVACMYKKGDEFSLRKREKG